jgi:GTP pyrophosphokinase
MGRKLFEKEAGRLRLKPKKLYDDPRLEKYVHENGYSKMEDVLVAIGYGKLIARQVLIRFIPEEELSRLDEGADSKLSKGMSVVRRALRLGDDRIEVKGVDDVMAYLAPCCKPIRGEAIIGYITRGKGVGVHASRCSNVANLLINRERIIDVAWFRDGANHCYEVPLTLMTEDRQGQLAALVNVLNNIKTNVRDMKTDRHVPSGEQRRIDFTIDIADLKHLEKVLNSLKRVPGVIDVERRTTA